MQVVIPNASVLDAEPGTLVRGIVKWSETIDRELTLTVISRSQIALTKIRFQDILIILRFKYLGFWRVLKANRRHFRCSSHFLS